MHESTSLRTRGPAGEPVLLQLVALLALALEAGVLVDALLTALRPSPL